MLIKKKIKLFSSFALLHLVHTVRLWRIKRSRCVSDVLRGVENTVFEYSPKGGKRSKYVRVWCEKRRTASALPEREAIQEVS